MTEKKSECSCQRLQGILEKMLTEMENICGEIDTNTAEALGNVYCAPTNWIRSHLQDIREELNKEGE